MNPIASIQPSPDGEARGIEPAGRAEGASSSALHGEDAVVRRVEALLVSEQGSAARIESVAVEMRADLFVDGSYWGTAALTPGDLEDYAWGAVFSAGLIADADDVSDVQVRMEGSVAHVEISLRDHVDVPPCEGGPRTPSGMVFPGCGLGGAGLRKTGPVDPLDPAAVWRMSRALLPAQGMHLTTGATHAAVFADREGNPVLMREDVGRHNAVDKLVGAMLRAHVDPSDGFAYLSSRCALELVTKLARTGVRIVATVSAPTSAVLDFAEDEGITLCAFARDGRFTVYVHPEAIAV